MMRGFHMFWRDRTMQVMKCNPWSTKLHPSPSLVQKMKTYLALEGKLGPKPRPQPQTQSQPSTSIPPQSNNSITRKAPRTQDKWKEEKNQSAYQKEVQIEGNCPAHTYHPSANCTTEFDLNCTYPQSSHYLHPNAHDKICCHIHPGDGVQFSKGKVWWSSLPNRKTPGWGNSFSPQVQPSTTWSYTQCLYLPIREDTPWPNTESATTNLFEVRADWPIPPTPAPTKTEVPPQIAVIPHSMDLPKQIGENVHGDHIAPSA